MCLCSVHHVTYQIRTDLRRSQAEFFEGYSRISERLAQSCGQRVATVVVPIYLQYSRVRLRSQVLTKSFPLERHSSREIDREVVRRPCDGQVCVGEQTRQSI